MATRHERVVLTLEDNFTTSAARAATATALINRELKSLSGQAVGTHKPLQETSRDVDKVTSSVRRGQNDLDRFSGRFKILRDLAVTIGPALAPIGAVAVPAITGLAAQFGAAALAGGTAIAAFQGVGDTLEAVNKAALEPTTDNLEAARLALQNLSPEARRFVNEIQAMRPALRELRDSAAAGLFPGLLEGLDGIDSVLPQIERLLFAVGDAAGELGADLGEALSSERGREFIEFLRTEIPGTLTTLGRSVGHVAAGLAELWEAFSPVNRSFAAFLQSAAEGFDDWAAGLSETEGFQDFVNYIRDNGPRVAEALGAIGGAVLSIVEAAAPLGGPVLEALTAVADVIGAIAESDAGPIILATATALSILSRGQKTFGSIAQSSWGQAIRGVEGYDKKVKTLRTTALRGSGAIAGLAIAGSGAADSIGLTNTMSLALMGTLGGPWGAAIGGAIGLMLDLGGSNEQAEADAESFTQTLDEQTGALTKLSREWAVNKLQQEGALGLAERLGLDLGLVTDAALGNRDAIKIVADELARLKIVDPNLTGDANDLMFILGGINGTVTRGVEGNRRYTEAMAKMEGGFDRTRLAAQAFRDEIERVNRRLEGRSDIRDYEQALDDLTKTLKDVKDLDKLFNKDGTFNIDLGKAREVQADFDAIAASAIKIADGMDAVEGKEFLRGARRDLIKSAEEMGRTRDQAVKLVDRLGILDAIKARPTVKIDGVEVVLSEAKKMELALNRIKSKTVTITTVFTGDDGRHFKDFSGYNGGWTGNVDPRQVAGIVHGREVVIPAWLAKRDAALLRQRYGFLPGMSNLRGYANGGYVDERVFDQRTYDNRTTAAGTQIDYARLAQAMAAMRPPGQLYGDVHISGDPAAFKQQMLHDQQRQGLGGFGG